MSSTSKFKIPYGERDGKIIHVSMVESGLNCGCVCPVCKERLIARKGAMKVHHFAHYSGAQCNAETVLHQLGKRLLAERISKAIVECREVPFKWNCSECQDEHYGNIVKKAVSLAIEKDMGACKPDITVFDSQSKPVLIIEIVVSHQPEENVLKYVQENKLGLLEFHLKTADDLETLDKSEILLPERVYPCIRPKCKVCGRPLQRKVLHVVEANCWKCQSNMRIAFINIEGRMIHPESFNKQDITKARECGASIKMNYSHTRKERYLSNTCRKCGTFTGEFYLHNYFHLMTAENGHQMGYICPECDYPESESGNEIGGILQENYNNNEDHLNENGAMLQDTYTKTEDHVKGNLFPIVFLLIVILLFSVTLICFQPK